MAGLSTVSLRTTARRGSIPWSEQSSLLILVRIFTFPVGGIIGGFGVSSDLMWDVMGGLGYEVSGSFSVFGGYRAASVDYSNNGFVYDVVQQGPIFAGVFRF